MRKAIRKAIPRRAITQTSVEIRSYAGKNDPRNRYLLVKGHMKQSDYYNVFMAHELKGACIDILGLQDSQKTRQTNANDLAKRVWAGP